MNNALNFAKQIFGTGNISKIEQFSVKFVKRYKITVFCPEKHTDNIAKAMSASGAGLIGRYSECSFRTKGTGTFKGGKGANPYTGKIGKLEIADEIRLEMICDAENLNNITNTMLSAHPYEEPAYDIYEVLNGIKQKSVYAVRLELKKPVNIGSVLKKISSRLDSTLILEGWKRINIKHAVVDLSGEEEPGYLIKNYIHRTLYIARNLKKTINIRLI